MNNRIIKRIWELRIQYANAEKRKAQAQHFITKHPFYQNEMDYWGEVNQVNDEFFQRCIANKKERVSS